MQTSKPMYTFSAEEVALMIILIAEKNPDRFPSPKAKALIYKCKAAREDDKIRFTVQQ